MLCTSGLGFVFWLVAANRFTPEAVGIATAATSAMTLINTFCMFGLGTLLITELPRNRGKELSLVGAGLIVVGGASIVIGGLFAFLAPYISPNLGPLGLNFENIVFFTIGVLMTSITFLIDQCLIGIMKGGVQFWRNALFTTAKLVILVIASIWVANKTGMTIYNAWTLGNIISMIPVIIYVIAKKGLSLKQYLPNWSFMRKLGPAAVQHHILNLILLAPPSALPLVVTIMLHPQDVAWFYVASMMATFLFTIASSLTTVLHAANAADASALAQKARLTMGLSLLIGVAANVVFFFGAPIILRLYGPSYAEHASWVLRILALEVFPLSIKNHYIAVRRIRDQIVNAMIPIAIGSILELVIAAIGAHLGGLNGLSIGWLAATMLEATFMLPLLLHILKDKDTSFDTLKAIIEAPTQELKAITKASIESLHVADVPTQQLAKVTLSVTTDMLRTVVIADMPTAQMPKISRADLPTTRIARSGVKAMRANKLRQLDSQELVARNIQRVTMPETPADLFQDDMNAPTIKVKKSDVEAERAAHRL